MSIKNITRIECDATIDGKKCSSVLVISDPPEGEVKGIENLVAIDTGGKKYYFCCMTHLVAFAVHWIKASEEHAARESRAHAAMEEIESIPPMENLSI